MADFEGLFRHLPEHHVVICKKCRFAPILNQIRRHLKDHHPQIPVKRRREVALAVQSVPDVAHRTQDVVYPRSRHGPVDDLTVLFYRNDCPYIVCPV